jgi:hypothetical protein
MSSAYAVVLYRLLHSNLSFFFGKLLNLSNILQAFGALMFLLEPKGRSEKDACSSFTVNIVSERISRLNIFLIIKFDAIGVTL